MQRVANKMRLSPLALLVSMVGFAAALIVSLFLFVPGLSARADVGDNGTGANTANIEVKYVMASAAKISFGVTKPQNLVYTLTDGTTTESNPITNSTSITASVVTSTTTWASGATVMLTIAPSGSGTSTLDGFGPSSTSDLVSASNVHMRRLISFGSFGITKLFAAFYNTPADFAIYAQLPPTVTTLQYALAQSSANPDISSWDVSHVENLYGFSSGASAFNRNLNSWDVSSVTTFTQAFSGSLQKFNNGNAVGVGGSMTWLANGSSTAGFSMQQMFYGNNAFNQDVSSWNVEKCLSFNSTFGQMLKFNNGQTTGSVGTAPLTWNTSNATNFSSMFTLAPMFNQSISSFDLSKATSTDNMFYSATVFNNGLASGAAGTLDLNTSLVTTMASMFKSASAFNQNISSWDLGKVTTTQSMFESATKFNNGLAAGTSGTLSWNTSLVTNMISMFKSASSFNQDVNSWNVSKVLKTESMFAFASVFNSPLNGWDVSSVTHMTWMFQKALAFNQPLDNWNTASLQYLGNFVDGASLFNQSLATFNITHVVNPGMDGIFGSGASSTSGMSSANIDATLVSWSHQNLAIPGPVGNIGAYGKPKWSTCAGYYAVQRLTKFTFDSTWTTPSTVPSGCTAPTVTWSSATVYVNNATAQRVSPAVVATSDPANPVRYVIAGQTGSGSLALCYVNYVTGEFGFLSANRVGTCTVRAFGIGETADNSTSNYVDVIYNMSAPVNAPTTLTATVVNDTQMNLSWTAPGSVGVNHTDYRIEYSADGGVSWVEFAHSPSPSVLTASITGLQGNTSYKFRVAVVNALGVNTYKVSNAYVTKISAPTSVIANSFESSAVTVSWVAATQGTATAITYRVEASISGVMGACTSTGTSCRIPSLTNGRTYTISVTPYAPGPSDGVAFSPSRSATPSAGITSLVTGTATATSVPLTWVQPVNLSSVTLADITGYTVQYSTGDYSTWSDASTTVAAGTGYTVTGLSANTNYKFRVRLNNPAGTAPWVTTSVAVLTSPTVPSAPTVVSGTSDVNGSSVITWTSGSSGGSVITGYKVEYSSDGTNWTTATASTASSGYTITGLTNGTSYYVRVSGINAIGTGLAGVSANTFMPGTLPGAPTSVSATSGGMGQSTVSWSAPSSDGGRAITGYTVTSTPGSLTCTATAPATSCVVTGLTYATNYTFTVTATNSLGASAASSASASILVGGLPTAPIVHNALRDGTNFNAVVIVPSSDGGSPITGYQYRYKLTIGGSWTAWANAPNSTATTVAGQPARSFEIPGITPTVVGQLNWGAIQFRAVNSLGVGATSVQAPNTVDITMAGEDNGQFTFNFDLSDDGNAPITDYQYQLMPSNTQVWSSWVSMGVTSDAQPFTITGLTNGIGYWLRVRAENAYGFSSGAQSTSTTIPTGYPNKPLPTLSLSYALTNTIFSANANFTPTFANNGNGSNTFSSLYISVCTVDPSTGVVTVVSSGTCRVRLTVGEGTLHRSSLVEDQFEVTAAAQSPLNWNVTSTSGSYMGSIVLDVTGGDGSGLVTYAKSGTSTCSITGAIVVLGEVGSVCSVTATKAAAGGYAAVSTTTPLLLTSTPIAQASVDATFGATAFVNQVLTLQATGGSGSGAYQYTVTNAGATGCVIDSATNTVSFTGAGSCVISVVRAASTNYTVSSATSKTIIVSRRSQVVTFTSILPTEPKAGDVYVAAASSSASLAVTISVTSGSCAIVNGEVAFSGVGACVISASQAGDAVFLSASASQTIVVGQRNQVLSFDAATNAITTKTFGGVGFVVQAVSSEASAAVSYSLSPDTTNSACSVTSSGFVTILAVGSCVIQVNAAGASTFAAASTITKTIGIVPDLPGAPAIGSLSAGNMHATIGFFAPSYTGGVVITGYKVIAIDQAVGSTIQISDSSCGTVPVNSSITCRISGLTNGSTYRFKVAAINEAGIGTFSALSAAITVATNPSAVQNLSVTEGNGSLIISWSTPASLGGGTFSAYRIFIKKSSESAYDQDHFFNVVNYNTSTVTVSLESPGDGMTFLGGPALQNGVAYDVKIVTVTTANLLELEGNTARVNQIPHTVPDAPLVASSVVVGGQLVITWAAPLSDGGKPITSYSVTFQNNTCALANPNDTLCAVALPTTPGTYTFQIVATNAAGQSLPKVGSFFVASVPSRQPAGSGSSSGPVTKPLAPIVKSVSVATDGKSITVLGSDLNEMVSVFIGSLEAAVVSRDGATLVLGATNIPAGVYDLMIAFKDGTKLREVGAVTIAGSKPNTPAKFSARKISGFAKGSATLKASQVRQLTSYFKTIRGTATIECIGSTEGPSILKADASLAMKRSSYICAIAKRAGVKVKSASYVNQVKVGAKYRSVDLKIWANPAKK